MERKRQMIASAIQITAVAGSRGSDLVVLPELYKTLGSGH